MSWTDATDQTTTYERPADLDNRYVSLAYIQNGYIGAEGVWSDSSDASTTWAAA